MAVIALADIYGVSGRRAELLSAFADAESAARDETGFVQYRFSEVHDDPDHFVLVSQWRDEAALDAHYASAAFAAYQFAVQGLLARPSEMTVYAVTKTTHPIASEPMDPRDAD
jgi:quinol monooxygenase YgiN